MSGSSRSRQKRKLEPISIEELAGTTGMSGFCTFLTRDASVRVPALEGLLETGAPVMPAPDAAAPDRPAPVVAAPVSPAPDIEALLGGPGDSVCPAPDAEAAIQSPAPILSAPLSTALDWAAIESSAPVYTLHRRLRIREAVTVQDGHSLAEQAVYDAMYRAGKPYQGDSRVLTIGLRTLAELSHLAYSNCKANVRSLAVKLAIDEGPGFSYTEGRTYVIYSFREILRRRKAAGLTHVVRTRGVAFVDQATGRTLTGTSALDSDAPGLSGPDSMPGALEPTGTGAPGPGQSSALTAPAHIRNRHLMRNPEEASSSSLAPIVTALRRYVEDVDDDAAADLWRRCTNGAPDAGMDEVVHFIHLKAGKPGIRIPLGFLLTAVPKCFKGDSYRQYRAEQQRVKEASQTRERLFAEEILKSPEADEEQKQWAREVLQLDV
jgi:hypothetical protein